MSESGNVKSITRQQPGPTQHLDIDIPIIEIAEGWKAESVRTDEDFNDAFTYLMSAVAQIEYQIDIEDSKPPANQDRVWLARAKCALKYKKAALHIVNQRHGRIKEKARRAWQDSKDRRLLEYIRKTVPDSTFMGWVKASNCDEIEKENGDDE